MSLSLVRGAYLSSADYRFHTAEESKPAGEPGKTYVLDGALLAESFGFLDYKKLQLSAFCVLFDSGTIFEEAALLKRGGGAGRCVIGKRR